MNTFNKSVEAGLKALLILKVVKSQKISLERIVFYDNFINEKEGHRGKQFNRYLRRVSFEEGIGLMLIRGLLDVTYTEKGIFYQANPQTLMFIELLESNYAHKYQKGIKQIILKYAEYTEEKIQQIRE